jgi:DNA-binding IclR family transcriptional regulator
MTGATRQAARHVAAVARALAVMDELATSGELGTNELARRTGVNASTVSRLLATLAMAGYVTQAPNGRYRLGVRLLQLGNSVVDRLDVRELAHPHLRDLVAAVGETATLSLPGEHQAITVDFVRSPSSVQSVAQIGRPSVAHATATGKVMLAFGDTTLPSGPLPRYTPRTIVDRRSLARVVEKVRGVGWAEAVGEREGDLAALAAPVRGSRGELAAILGVQGPASRLDSVARRRALGPMLEAAGRLSEELGWVAEPDVSPREAPSPARP